MNVRYKIGLLLAGLFLLGIILKSCIFSNVDDQGFLINISTEILGAIITLLIVDRILKAEEERKQKKLFAIAIKSLKNPLRRYINMWLHINNSIDAELKEDLCKATSLKEYMLSDMFIGRIQHRSFNERYTESDIFGSKDNRTLKQIVPKMHEQFLKDIDRIIANYAYALDFETLELLQHFGETAHLYGTFYFWNTVDIGDNKWFQLQKSENIKSHFESLFILIEKYNNNVSDVEKWSKNNILTLTRISGEVPTVKW